ncbi:MAG: hypothetical protein Crog4KO_06570 [Crocinitomicaceae bacterium]
MSLGGAGITISALIFALLEFGLLTSQVIFYRSIKSSGIKHFIGITSLFVLYNIYFLLESIGLLGDNAYFIYIINSLAIGLYLIPTVLRQLSGSRKSWFNLVSAIAIFTIALFSTFYLAQVYGASNSFQKILNAGLLLLLLSAVVTVVSSLQNLAHGNRLTGLSITSLISLLVVSYSTYFEDSEILFLLVSNSLFLFFAILQYLKLYSLDKVIAIPKAEKNDPLNEYNLTKNQKEITLLILEGKGYSEIAEIRHIAYTTVTSHASMIFDKVGVENRTQLIKKLTK